MVVVRICGGLGNQMFQYAFAKNLQEQGKEVKLDITYYDNIPASDTKRCYELNIFKCTLSTATREEIRKYWNVYEMAKAKFKYYFQFLNSKIIFEKDVFKKEELLSLDEGYYIGWWQNEKYFKNIRQDILAEFSFAEEKISEETKSILHKINEAEESVSLHIRGNDYLNSVNSETYGNICTRDYYLKAYDYFKEKNKKIVFFIFSNDLKLTEEIFGVHDDNIYYVNMSRARKDWEDMFLMTKCTHNIIANSTFSWWGAWLNSNKNREVIAPLKWTNVLEDNPQCSEWIKI